MLAEYCINEYEIIGGNLLVLIIMGYSLKSFRINTYCTI